MLVVTSLILLFVSFLPATYAYVFIGCLSSSYTPVNSVSVTATSSTTGQTCSSSCSSLGYGYLYAYLENAGTSSATCECSGTAPTNSYYATGTDSAGTCSSSQIASYITQTTYSFHACYYSIEQVNNDLVTYSGIATTEACLQTCDSYALAFYYPSTGECQCSTASTGYDAIDCSESTTYLYSHTAGTSVGGASAYAKRQLRERLTRSRKTRTAFCPLDLVPCKIAGSEEAFECIDASSELESCGGCVNGEFNRPESSSGVDCSSLPGIPIGAVTCTKGKCDVFACREGWVLSSSNNTCVAT